MLKKKNNIFLLLFLLAGFFPSVVFAQRSTVSATVQPSDILIGEQAVIDLKVIAPKDRNIIFPLFPDTLVKGIEVLKMLPPDTVMTEVMTISQKYLITSFDSTLYHIPYMEIIDGTDTIRSNDFGIKVTSPQLSDSTLAYLEKLNNHQVDSLNFDELGISDIKDIQSPEFVWQDYLAYIYIPLLILIALALIALVIYFILKKRKKGYYFKPEVILPPHIVALKELDHLKAEKIWQKGREKEFYTKLTDILREYVDRRFNIDAPEMTSDEIISAMRRASEISSPVESLSQILHMADLVKFAKFVPVVDENELSMMNAYLFVNQTKIEEIQPPVLNGETKNEEKTEDKTTKTNS